MSTSHIQWADLSTSQENKRRSVELFAGQEEVSVDEKQLALLSSIQRAVEQERHRIAEDLHDSVAQDIALALHKLEYVQHLLEQSQLYQAFQEVTHVARTLEHGLDNLRGSIEALLPQQFAQQPAFASLATLIQEYQQDHPELLLDCRVEPDQLLTHIPIRLEVPIFRFVQEALNNVWQHATATQVVISLTLVSNVLTVEVCDNGNSLVSVPSVSIPSSGSRKDIDFRHLPGGKLYTQNSHKSSENALEFESGSPHAGDKSLRSVTDAMDDTTPAKLGLRIMRERVEQVGGTWEMQCRPGGGMCVRAVFPLEP